MLPRGVVSRSLSAVIVWTAGPRKHTIESLVAGFNISFKETQPRENIWPGLKMRQTGPNAEVA
jgi:hypothetical protein